MKAIDAHRDVTQCAGRKAAVQVGSTAELQLTTDTKSVKVVNVDWSCKLGHQVAAGKAHDGGAEPGRAAQTLS